MLFGCPDYIEDKCQLVQEILPVADVPGSPTRGRGGYGDVEHESYHQLSPAVTSDHQPSLEARQTGEVLVARQELSVLQTELLFVSRVYGRKVMRRQVVRHDEHPFICMYLCMCVLCIMYVCTVEA